MVSIIPMFQECTIKTLESESEYGEPERYNETILNCRYELIKKLSKDSTGTFVEIDGTVFLPGNTAVNPNDLIVINGIEYSIVMLNRAPDFFGDMQEIEIGIKQGEFKL